MSAPPLVDVVIPVFNAWDLTAQCLEALAANDADAPFGVRVVDNGSTDATPEACPALGRRLLGERFGYLRFEANRNFGPACNAGARESGAEYVCFLNNDTIPETGWLGPLVRALADDPNAGAAGPLLLYPGSRRVQHLGVAYDPLMRVEHLFHNFPEGHPVVARPRRLQALSAAALLMPRALFLELGGFHEGYANGFEDLELCARLREAGRTLVCAPGATVLHLESQTAGRMDADDANAALFSRRCAALVEPDLHGHLRAEGYELRVTPWFETYAALPAARAADLAALARAGVDAGKVWELLRMEPLWDLGYSLLADALERGGQWAEACELRTLHQEMCPSLANLQALAVCAARAGRPEDAARAMAYLKRHEALLADTGARAARLAELAPRLAGQPPEVRALFEAAATA